MKILFVTRLFTGLETSAKSTKWEPTGVPTIYKIIEKIANSRNELTLIWACKDTYSTWENNKDLEIQLEGLDADIRILAGKNRFPAFLGYKLRFILRELWQIIFTIRLYRKLKPDLVYVDNANMYVGALLSRFTQTSVIFRVMGVYPSMKNALFGKGIVHRIMRWCYSSPYKGVICTQDGSGIEPWLKFAIKESVEVHSLINGVDLLIKKVNSASFSEINRIKTIFLFVGKLIDSKGALQFLKGFMALHEKYPTEVHALMIGNGGLLDQISQLVKEKKLDQDVTLISHLPHEKILEAHQISDVYVSLNRFGNLSVANLEAMKSGGCMIFPASQPESSIDLVTDTLIPPSAAIRISSTDDISGLTNAMEILHLNPKKREEYKKNMEAAATFIPSWSERIEAEYDLLSSLGRNN